MSRGEIVDGGTSDGRRRVVSGHPGCDLARDVGTGGTRGSLCTLSAGAAPPTARSGSNIVGRYRCSVPNDRADNRVARLAVTALASALIVIVVYVIAIRTHLGQRIDGVAFNRRDAVSAATTRRTDRLLGTVSVASLLLVGGALVVVALARRRKSLAVAVGVAMGGAVLTTEILKTKLLTRPNLGNFGGVGYNTFPSGHTTIGMAISLGLVMVAPKHLGRPAAVVAALVSTAFGTAVLSSGWHRPSDTIGAYFVTLGWFGATSAVLALAHRRNGTDAGSVVDPTTSRPLMFLAAVGVFGLLMFVLWKSIDATGLRTVVYAAPYVAACVGIDLAGIVVVGVFYVIQRASLRPLWVRHHP